MDTVDRLILVMHENDKFIKELKYYIPDMFTIIEKKKIKSVFQELRINHVVCIVIHIEHDIPDNTHLEQLKKKFSHIPCIAVIPSSNMELARYCGSIGIECVLSFDKIHSIKEEIEKIFVKKSGKVFLEDLSIKKKDPIYSAILRESLLIMERNYLEIFNISQIANVLEINESTLSREFNKFDLPGPKKILMFLKVNHAIRLMQNKGLNIREISSMSGFSDEKRMAECFIRMFKMPPGEYRFKFIEKKIKGHKIKRTSKNK